MSTSFPWLGESPSGETIFRNETFGFGVESRSQNVSANSRPRALAQGSPRPVRVTKQRGSEMPKRPMSWLWVWDQCFWTQGFKSSPILAHRGPRGTQGPGGPRGLKGPREPMGTTNHFKRFHRDSVPLCSAAGMPKELAT